LRFIAKGVPHRSPNDTTEQQVTHAKQIYSLTGRIKGLQDYLKIERQEEKVEVDWLEDTIDFKGHKKEKR
jgi:hypothetical protein